MTRSRLKIKLKIEKRKRLRECWNRQPILSRWMMHYSWKKVAKGTGGGGGSSSVGCAQGLFKLVQLIGFPFVHLYLLPKAKLAHLYLSRVSFFLIKNPHFLFLFFLISLIFTFFHVYLMFSLTFEIPRAKKLVFTKWLLSAYGVCLATCPDNLSAVHDIENIVRCTNCF